MRALLDGHLDYRLAQSLPSGFDVRSAQWMGWAGMSDGELLAAAAAVGFDALVTADRSMRYQQPQPPLPVLALEAGSTELPDLQRCIPQMARTLAGPLEPGYHACGPSAGGRPAWRPARPRSERGGWRRASVRTFLRGSLANELCSSRSPFGEPLVRLVFRIRGRIRFTEACPRAFLLAIWRGRSQVNLPLAPLRLRAACRPEEVVLCRLCDGYAKRSPRTNTRPARRRS